MTGCTTEGPCGCSSCSVAAVGGTDSYQLHLTVDCPLDPAEVARMKGFLPTHYPCEVLLLENTSPDMRWREGPKAITSANLSGGTNYANALVALREAVEALRQAGYTVTRQKIEAAPWNKGDSTFQSVYWEAHAKLPFWTPSVEAVAGAYGLALSRNLDKRGVLLTLRLKGNHLTEDRMRGLMSEALDAAGRSSAKITVERTLLDSNEGLDDEWFRRCGLLPPLIDNFTPPPQPPMPPRAAPRLPGLGANLRSSVS